MNTQKHSQKIFYAEDLLKVCDQAIADGGDFPLSRVFSVGKTPRCGLNNTKYFPLLVNDGTTEGRLCVRFYEEKHVGLINPTTESECIRVASERNCPPIEPRTRPPAIGIQKYNRFVDVDKDTGKPIGPLPDDSCLSKFYALMEHIDSFFYEEMDRRIKNKLFVMSSTRGPPPPADAIVIPNCKITQVVQTNISENSLVNAGNKLANPLCRISIKFNKHTNLTKGVIYDYEKRKEDAKGKVTHFPLTFNGAAVTNDNIHNIRSGSIVSGVVVMDSVCSSNMGLSIPSDIKMLIVAAPVTTVLTVQDVFADTEICDASKLQNEALPTEPETGVADVLAKTVLGKPATLSDNDLENILDELTV